MEYLFELGNGVLEALRIATSVGTPIALVAFIVVAVIYAYQYFTKARLENEQKKIESDLKKLELIPEADRAKAVDESLTRYGLSAENLTRDQKFSLLHKELENKHDLAKGKADHGKSNSNRWFWGFIATLIFLLAVVAIDYYFRNATAKEPIVPPPESFDVKQVDFNYGLPEKIFGSISDPSRSRQILESVDEANLSRFGKDAHVLWLYTDEFKGRHGDFTAFVYVGSEASVEIQAFHARFSPTFSPSPLTALHGQGPKSEYRFQVKDSQKEDRVLVSVGMSKETYESIKGRRISIRSQPFQPDS